MSVGAGNWALSQIDESVAIGDLLNRLIEALEGLDAHLATYQANVGEALVDAGD